MTCAEIANQVYKVLDELHFVILDRYDTVFGRGDLQKELYVIDVKGKNS